MRVFVDTNLLLYAANCDVKEHESAMKFLADLVQKAVPWCLSWPAVYEFLRFATHPRVFARPL